MRKTLRRGLAVVAACGLAGSAVVALTVGSGTAGAAQDFYAPPSPLPVGADGDLVRSESFSFPGATAARVMYLSRDQRGARIAVTGSVLVPTARWSGAGVRPVVGYASFTSGMGDQCAPSKVLSGQGSDGLPINVQKEFVTALLAKGFAVAQTDYQGLGTPGDHTYVMSDAQGHAVLDAVRAAKRLPGAGLDPAGPVGVVGYSQGGNGAAAAAELAGGYAPELDVRGVYAGAPPADLGVLAKTLDGAYAAGFLGFALIGMNTAYPEADINGLTNEAGRQLFAEASKVCTFDAILRFAFKQTRTLTKDGRPVSAYVGEEPFRSILADLKLGGTKPAMPVLVEHAPGDDIVDYGQGKQLAKDWCALGGAVQFRDIATLPFLPHVFGGIAAKDNAAAWLADRFAGKAHTPNCGRF